MSARQLLVQMYPLLTATGIIALPIPCLFIFIFIFYSHMILLSGGNFEQFMLPTAVIFLGIQEFIQILGIVAEMNECACVHKTES